MNTISIVTLSGTIVVVNKLATGKWQTLDARFVIGSLVYLLFMAGINQAQPELASKLALLFLVGIVYVYVPELVKLMGF